MYLHAFLIEFFRRVLRACWCALICIEVKRAAAARSATTIDKQSCGQVETGVLLTLHSYVALR